MPKVELKTHGNNKYCQDNVNVNNYKLVSLKSKGFPMCYLVMMSPSSKCVHTAQVA